eukprot:scaffold9.g3083.t1
MSEVLSDKQRRFFEIEAQCSSSGVEDRLALGTATQTETALLLERESLRRELEAASDRDARKRSRAEAIFSHLNSGLRFSMLTGAIIIALGIVAGAVAGANIGGEKVVHAAHNHHLHHHFSFARRRRSEESELI